MRRNFVCRSIVARTVQNTYYQHELFLMQKNETKKWSPHKIESKVTLFIYTVIGICIYIYIYKSTVIESIAKKSFQTFWVLILDVNCSQMLLSAFTVSALSAVLSRDLYILLKQENWFCFVINTLNQFQIIIVISIMLA